MKTALITGISGQDGTYLKKHLTTLNYKIIGIDMCEYYENGTLFKKNIDLNDFDQISNLITKEQPDEIYHLAAYHGSSEDKSINEIKLMRESLKTNVLSTHNILESIRLFSQNTKLFYASSSHMFGAPSMELKTEKSKFEPSNIYGITKLASTNLCNYYKTVHNVFATVGILYAHESPIRGPNFVSQKIVRSAVNIKNGKQKELILGSLEAEINWGFAEDYVRAMQLILQLKEPDVFIITSGDIITIKEIVVSVFGYLDLNWKNHVKLKPSILNNKVSCGVRGDNSKLKEKTGWDHKSTFNQLIIQMIEYELERSEL